MKESPSATLHVTNGDAALYLFAKAAIPGVHVAWRDALNDGPVPQGLSLEQTSSVRIAYLAQRGLGNPIRNAHTFQQRDRLVQTASAFQEVVLWFEHDLYDQLQILQILTVLEALELEPGSVSIVQTDAYLSAMTAEEIAALFPRRRTVTAATYRSARKGWERFTATSPRELFDGAREDAIGLPYLRAAFQRLCEEYPSARDGLSRSQMQALQAVAQGPGSAAELFRRAQAREEASFLGDNAFARLLEDLRTSNVPLVETQAGSLVPTAVGRRILAGDADWLEEAQLDRWIGGVHLERNFIVRWDDDGRCFRLDAAFREPGKAARPRGANAPGKE